MSRNNNSVALVIALLSLMLGAPLAACQQTPPRLDLVTVAACPGEAGPSVGGPVPCVWDAQTMGNGQAGPYAARWTLYADTCPVTTVQDFRLVHCVSRKDWDGS